ncbi:MAG: GH3 auxin-responsive promoter family protein, partial [Bacteroidota bacterium]|nr:GH3 auxin-responsive promoter family protein [Bacteroidota bacterium]
FQEKIFKKLIAKGRQTSFGKDHQFSKINNYEDFKKNVPIADYEDLKNYIERVKEGEIDVLWPGKPLYFAKTSGTTSGTKYIPITKESIPTHINSARDALFNYVVETGNANFFDRKLIFLSGSPEIEKNNGIYVGRLSGISNHHVPQWLRNNQMPSYETNCMDDWEAKVDKIVEETVNEDMALISGIPPWVQMYFDKLQSKTGKKIKDIFPNFSVFVYGGVNFEPYKAKLFDSIGKDVDNIETYPASEGFIAYQNKQGDKGLLLCVNNGMFYEFIPADEYHLTNRRRLQLKDVELGVNYALIINSTAGLWGYSIGDTVKFVSKNPYKIIVSGRIKHFISAFGEHVIGEEVEKSIKYACEQQPEVEVVEFTVAPQVIDPNGGLPYHEWFIEFGKEPADLQKFKSDIDSKLQELNSYYFDLISGNILQQLKITVLKKGTFIEYMKSLGKLGGQNKLPRLSNDRKIAEVLEKLNN